MFAQSYSAVLCVVSYCLSMWSRLFLFCLVLPFEVHLQFTIFTSGSCAFWQLDLMSAFQILELVSRIVTGFLRQNRIDLPKVLEELIIGFIYLSQDSFADPSHQQQLHWEEEEAPTWLNPHIMRLSNTWTRDFAEKHGAFDLFWAFKMRFSDQYSARRYFIVGFLNPNNPLPSPSAVGQSRVPILEPFTAPNHGVYAHCRMSPEAGSTGMYCAIGSIGRIVMAFAQRKMTRQQGQDFWTITVRLVFRGDLCYFQMRFGHTEWLNIYNFKKTDTKLSGPRCLVLAMCGLTHLELLKSGCTLYSAGKRKAEVPASDESRRPHKKIKLLRNSCFSTR